MTNVKMMLKNHYPPHIIVKVKSVAIHYHGPQYRQSKEFDHLVKEEDRWEPQ